MMYRQDVRVGTGCPRSEGDPGRSVPLPDAHLGAASGDDVSVSAGDAEHTGWWCTHGVPLVAVPSSDVVGGGATDVREVFRNHKIPGVHGDVTNSMLKPGDTPTPSCPRTAALRRKAGGRQGASLSTRPAQDEPVTMHTGDAPGQPTRDALTQRRGAEPVPPVLVPLGASTSTRGCCDLRCQDE